MYLSSRLDLEPLGKGHDHCIDLFVCFSAQQSPGAWACANLQGCHMDFVIESLLLGRFYLVWILLWVSYFCSVSPAQIEP